MTDHPMIFSNPMVRALWDGRKSPAYSFEVIKKNIDQMGET